MELHEYQKKAVEFIEAKKKCVLFLKMGLGKTIISLKAMKGKTLCIAPARVASHTWHNEIEKWGLPITYSLVIGNPKARLESLKTKVDIYIISRDNIVWLLETGYLKWDTIIIDELSSFKESNTKRFKALRKFKYTNIIGLTATPTSNHLKDIWSQIYLIDQGERLLKSKTKFLQEYFYAISKGMYIDYKPREKAEELIYKKIEGIVMRMEKRDGLPSITYNEVNVALSPSERALYHSMKRDYILKYKNSVITAANGASLLSKLLQIASGEVYNEKRETTTTNNKKISMLQEIIEAQNGEPLMVCYAFIHEKNRIIDLCKSLKLTYTDSDFTGWNNKEYDLLVVHPASCAYGLNLQKGGSTLVWFTPCWSLELHDQANARLHRQGQTQPVVINYLLCENTVDEYVLKCLKRKDTNQQIFLNLFKELGM
jgi:SNF2 family DNA or RNA helicase